MSYVTLQRAKVFCKVEVSDDDELLAFLINAAEGHVAKFLGASLSCFLQDNSNDSVPDLDRALEPAVELGILMHVDDWYEHRDINSEAQLTPNKMAENVLHFWRVGLGV
jgi:hypothetical protein